MIAELLFNLLPFAGGFGTMAAAYGGYRATKWWKRRPKPEPQPDQPLVDLIKEGYEVAGKLAREVHELYHPPGCKCAICTIKADDDKLVPLNDNTVYCENPCYGCSVITCLTHPDKRPEIVRDQVVGPMVPASQAPPPKPAEKRSDTQEGRYDTQYVKALESKIKGLREHNNTLTNELTQLRASRGLQSAGFHVGGKPTYHVVPVRDKPASGPGSRPPLDEPEKPSHKDLHRAKTDIENHQKLHPGGAVIEQFGYGPIRYNCIIPRCGYEPYRDGPMPGYFSVSNGDGSWTMKTDQVEATFGPVARERRYSIHGVEVDHDEYVTYNTTGKLPDWYEPLMIQRRENRRRRQPARK